MQPYCIVPDDLDDIQKMSEKDKESFKLWLTLFEIELTPYQQSLLNSSLITKQGT